MVGITSKPIHVRKATLTSIAFTSVFCILILFYKWLSPACVSVSSFIIPMNSSVNLLATRLFHTRLDVAVFKLLYRLRISPPVYYGEYSILPTDSMLDIIKKFEDENTVLRAFLVTEGMTTAQVKKQLAAADGMVDDLPQEVNEGELWPDTYYYSWFAKRDTIISMMKEKMRTNLKALWEGREPDLPFFTPSEAIILASIIEKEAGNDAEKQLIASVFINRLNKGMKLQADPTVLYAIFQNKPDRKYILKKSDMSYESRYNTYIYPGLPPGPISNPGYASIYAALHPAKTNYLYFVATGVDKAHIFSDEYKTHVENVRAYKLQKNKTTNTVQDTKR